MPGKADGMRLGASEKDARAWFASGHVEQRGNGGQRPSTAMSSGNLLPIWGNETSVWLQNKNKEMRCYLDPCCKEKLIPELS